MGQKFCTLCGTVLTDGVKYCENCGTPVEQDVPPLPALKPEISGKIPLKIIAGIVIVIIITAAAVFVVLPKISGGMNLLGSIPDFIVATPTATIAEISPVLTTFVTTAAPTPTPDPFPNALSLKQKLPFGSGNLASEGTVYKFWINSTYQWHNDQDQRYYVQKPKAGNKYLFVFVQMTNNGDTRVWFPPAGSIAVYYDGALYTPDPTHKLPEKIGNLKDTPVEVKEIQYYQKLNGAEYVEDFGYSHGTTSDFLYPGKSNAIDGYIIYEVPQSLTPEKTYVEIPFNNQDRGVWKLA